MECGQSPPSNVCPHQGLHPSRRLAPFFNKYFVTPPDYPDLEFTENVTSACTHNFFKIS